METVKDILTEDKNEEKENNQEDIIDDEDNINKEKDKDENTKEGKIMKGEGQNEEGNSQADYYIQEKINDTNNVG